MQNKKLTFTALLIMLFFSLAQAVPAEENSLLKDVKLGIDFGFGMPYEWGTKKSNSSKYEASGNISLGVNLGYDFHLSTLYKNFKLGPEIGLIYGFTRKLQVSNHVSLAEKYLYLPISFYLFEENRIGENGYFALGGSVGYEFNILLSSIYINKKGENKLYPASQPVKDAEGYTLEIPNISGSIIANLTSYFSHSIYLGMKFRVPIEALQEKGTDSFNLSEEFLRSSRVKTNSIVEFYLGVDIMKWL